MRLSEHRCDDGARTGAMLLLIAVGAVGAILHFRTDLGPGGQMIPERLIGFAPVMAPLLFGNMGVVGLVALLPEREHAA